MIPIKVGDNTYTSIAAAWRETGQVVPLITVRWRLKNGWTPDLAFSMPVVIPQDRRTFKTIRDNIDDVQF